MHCLSISSRYTKFHMNSMIFCDNFFYRAYVRIVRSGRPGSGKSLYIKRLGEDLMKRQKVDIKPIVMIPLHGPHLYLNWIMDQFNKQPISNKIIHLDISNLVCFFLFIINCFDSDWSFSIHRERHIWQCFYFPFLFWVISVMRKEDHGDGK